MCPPGLVSFVALSAGWQWLVAPDSHRVVGDVGCNADRPNPTLQGAPSLSP